MTAVVVLAATTVAYADHVDNNIWIETAEGHFVVASDKARNHIEETYLEYYNHALSEFVHNQSCGLSHLSINWYKPESMRINNFLSIEQRKGDCGNKQAEENYFNEAFDDVEKTEEDHQQYHECMCGYWYENVVEDTYTYTIIDLPRDRPVPANYERLVVAGVEAGLDRWGDVNDITFEYTDSRLRANIVVQQQIGDGTSYGNADPACLFDNQQCTIQLFTDLNVRETQTLVNAHSIDWTVAHEFGHLIGLPHHIEPDNIMNTVQDDDTRTYYEARNINVPTMTEPTYEQRLLTEDDLRGSYAPTIPGTNDIAQLRAEYDGIVSRILSGDGGVDDILRVFEIVELLFAMLE